MDREYIINNICDHFVFEEDLDLARNRAFDFVMDCFRRDCIGAVSLINLFCAINSLWLFCKNEKVN